MLSRDGEPKRPLRRARLVSGAIRLVAGVVMVGILGCGTRPLHRPLPNVILIVIDTLRADRLGAYGNTHQLTPFLDRLAAESIVYERAYAPSAWTVPSIASMFVAQYPSEHQVVVLNAVLPDDAVTLAEVLSGYGFLTGGFSANLEISAEGGFAQGFDRFRTIVIDPKADAVNLNRSAFSWMDEISTEKRPFFLYLQYMEPHGPYRVHDGVTAGRTPDLDADDSAISSRVNAGIGNLWDTGPPPAEWNFQPAELRRLMELYDGEVAYLDRSLRALFDDLERRGVLRDALVIVTADHGEEFGEHGVFSHGVTLFEPAIHVPLIVRLPGQPAPRRIARPVTVCGLGPTILRALGRDVPASFRVAALPLEATLAGVGEPPYAYTESIKDNPLVLRLHRRAVVGERTKLLVSQTGEQLFYDLASDPAEQNPLTTAPFAADLRQALNGITSALALPAERQSVPLDAATRERLHALGYVN